MLAKNLQPLLLLFHLFGLVGKGKTKLFRLILLLHLFFLFLTQVLVQGFLDYFFSVVIRVVQEYVLMNGLHPGLKAFLCRCRVAE